MTNLQTKKRQHSIAHMKSKATIQQLIDAAYEALKNPIRMLDNCYNLLTSSKNTVTDDPLWNELKSKGKFSHDTVDFLISEQLVDEMAEADTAIRLSNYKLKYERIFCKVYDKNGEQIGHVIVVACYRQFVPGDIELVKQLCEHVGDSIDISVFSREDGRTHNEKVLKSLIEGKLHDNTINEASMEILYSNLNGNFYIAVVDTMPYDHTLTHLEFFRDLFAHLFDEYKFFIYCDNIVILISTDSPVLSLKRDLNKLNSFFSKYGIYAGVSGSYENLFETNKYYKQALNALNYGSEDNSGQHIFMYDEYKSFCNIKLATNYLNIEEEYCNPIILAIICFDTENQTSYYDTLRTYFMMGNNVKLASEKLEMSQDELYRQLSEIEDIFQIDRNNGNTMLSLHLSMKIRRFFLTSN